MPADRCAYCYEALDTADLYITELEKENEILHESVEKLADNTAKMTVENRRSLIWATVGGVGIGAALGALVTGIVLGVTK